MERRLAESRTAELRTAGPRVMVNGQPRELGEVGGHVTLLDWLRGRGLTGCKEGCAEGECGACAVLVARAGRRRTAPAGPRSTPAWCRPPASTARRCHRRGPGPARTQLHPVQREMADRGGSQCGYCTPGFICSMAAEYYRRPTARPARRHANGEPPAAAGAADHEHGPNGFDLHALSGNLCRCTGYRPIRDAAYALGPARRGRPVPGPAGRSPRRPRPPTTARPAPGRLRPAGRPGRGTGAAGRAPGRPAGGRLHRLGRRAEHPARPGRADHRHRPAGRAARARPSADDRIDIGAALTLTEIERGLAGRVPLLAELFPQFASRLIRNGATLGGNLGTASPIGDTPPALLALDASLVLASRDGEREVALADYFTGYRQTRQAPGRADQDDPHPDCRSPRSARSTRSPSAGSTTSPAWRSASRCGSDRRRRRSSRSGSGSAAWPRRRCGRCATEAGAGRPGRGPARWSPRPRPRCWPARARR